MPRPFTLRRVLSVAAPLLLPLLASPAVAQVDVLSIAASRFPTTWTLDGSRMEETRAKLLHPGNFGLGGTVESPIVIHDSADPIDLTLLADIEIVFIGYHSDASPNAFSEAELDALVSWVGAGGSILITCDDASYDAVCARFGQPVAGNVEGFATAAQAGWSHPVLDGPFGAVRQVATAGDVATFEDAAFTTVLLVSDHSRDPLVLSATQGAGRVLLFGDVDLISDDTLSVGTGIERPNDALLGNAFAWLARASADGACEPDDTTLCIDDAPGDGRFKVQVTFDTELGGGLNGTALATSLSGLGAPTGGLFTFFDPSVPEMVLKVINGCDSNDHYWIFFSAGTNAGFTVTVEDLIADSAPWTYTNPDLTAAPAVQDILALPCD